MIWPRSAILHKAAASIVEGTFGLTVSIADRIATRTGSTRSARARSMAFWTMWTLSSSVGAMLTAASVMMSAVSWPGTSITKQWLIRRAVRRPPSRRTTAPISSSVCRLPFIGASAWPDLHEIDGRLRCRMAVRGLDDAHLGDVCRAPPQRL